ncbi:response regulator [Eubacterium sp. MSJ-13]|uniref:HD domain-containing phosphohydrolase n=1 Tax=Eubacterium sp. MSJ-13 TaxID=2841513 RepID=UPI001C11CA92|nr:HD domain-containing phosphohydrolase [Eubacterium sp. MSJ-13]MBU5478818.1 response regulator [Eubacterium sp. MSJ-13]
MKNLSKKQYITTLIVCFLAITILSFCTIQAFYKKAVSDTLSVGESALKQQMEQMDSYLSRGMDAVELTAITVEYMLRENYSSDDILNFLTEESKYYKRDVDKSFTGIYGLFDGEYLDGIGWQPGKGYVPQDREWYKAAVAAEGEPTFVQPYLDAQTNTVMVSISQLLEDKESVISLDIDLGTLQEETEAIKLNGHGYGFVCDKTGLVVTHSDDKSIGKDYSKGEMSPIYNKVVSGGDQIFTYKMKSGKVTVFSAPIMDEWYAVMVINNDKLYQKVSRLIIYDVSLSIVLYIVIVIFCTMSRRITMRTLNELDETNNELIEINDSVMQALAKTIDAKDKYTKGHSVRVANYSRELAARMGKSKKEQDEIYQVALLHDMGKIRIPDAIINKPGKLTEQEFSMIKLHPVTGYHILKGIRRFKDLGIGAKYHHEHYDGTGYPSGLKGENIPEIARIIAVADSYDAMASNRSYRNALPQEVVRGEIEKGKGTQFDPAIADVMLQMIDEDKNYDMKQTDELKRRILVVDDQKMNLMLVKGICKDEPMYEIFTLTSGQEAIDFIKDNEVDLLLLDIEMPEMDGFETLSKIREFSDIKVAFITATRDYDTIEKARGLGVEDYITKPFLPAVFLETIHGIID